MSLLEVKLMKKSLHLSIKIIARYNAFAKRIVGIATMLAAIMIISAPLPAEARKITTKLKSPTSIKTTTKQAARIEKLDSLQLAATSPLISFSGYDKAASVNKESFLITNDSDIPIARLLLDIIYTDLDGRMINRRQEPIDAVIPQGETRAVSIKAFDPQRTLYYKRSTPPRKGGAPFDVKITIIDLYRPL